MISPHPTTPQAADLSPQLAFVANARMPSQRAQSLQVAQMTAAFQRSGLSTTLVHALRKPPGPPLPEGTTLWEHYNAGQGPWPELVAIPHFDLIDRFPVRAQFAPARLQEWSFSRNAARWIAHHRPGALVLSREVEAAKALVALGVEDVFLEIHRVAGGKLRRAWLREACAECRGVIAISDGVRADLVDGGYCAAEDVIVERDGFAPDRFASLPTRSEARRELGADEDRPLVVYTGALLSWKGVDLLARAALDLPDVQFIIAGGSDADVARVQREVGEAANVRFDGFQAPARVAIYLRAADLGVVPNRSQPAISARYTSPLKVFEMMACGLPMVASDLPSLREILEPETEAFFVEPDDVKAFAAGIERALAEESTRQAMSERLKARSAKYSWDARAERIHRWMLERRVRKVGA